MPVSSLLVRPSSSNRETLSENSENLTGRPVKPQSNHLGHGENASPPFGWRSLLDVSCEAATGRILANAPVVVVAGTLRPSSFEKRHRLHKPFSPPSRVFVSVGSRGSEVQAPPRPFSHHREAVPALASVSSRPGGIAPLGFVPPLAHGRFLSSGSATSFPGYRGLASGTGPVTDTPSPFGDEGPIRRSGINQSKCQRASQLTSEKVIALPKPRNGGS